MQPVAPKLEKTNAHDTANGRPIASLCVRPQATPPCSCTLAPTTVHHHAGARREGDARGKEREEGCAWSACRFPAGATRPEGAARGGQACTRRPQGQRRKETILGGALDVREMATRRRSSVSFQLHDTQFPLHLSQTATHGPETGSGAALRIRRALPIPLLGFGILMASMVRQKGNGKGRVAHRTVGWDGQIPWLTHSWKNSRTVDTGRVDLGCTCVCLCRTRALQGRRLRYVGVDPGEVIWRGFWCFPVASFLPKAEP